MPYSSAVSRANPTCLIFLLDQSASMREPMPDGGGLSKAQSLANAINDLLYEIVLRCRKERNEPPFHYFDIALIGYGSRAVSLIPGYTVLPVHQIAGMNVRVQQDANGGMRPIWFDAVADGTTAMCGAIDLAGQIVDGWVHSHPASFPPLVFNITDGVSTDGDPEPWAQRLRSLGTSDGQLLMFNVNISSTGGRPLQFPDSQGGLPDDFARTLFRMSSPLPDPMRAYAAELGVPVSAETRGFVYNAGVSAMVMALDVGTRPLPGA